MQQAFLFDSERVKSVMKQLKVAVLILFIFHINFSDSCCNFYVSVLDSMRAMGFGI
jgi:hypothetical protein